MSDIYPITLARYNDWKKAGLVDENQIYQIYDTDEDIAKELIRTRKALDVAVDALKWIAYDENDEQDGLEEFAISQMIEKADNTIKAITELEQKDKKCVK